MSKLLLLSGGLDSTALAYWLRPDVAVTINYGQAAAEAELLAAKAVCEFLSLKHEVLNIDLKSLGSGPMAGTEQHNVAISPEWWPFRNQLLATLGGAIAIKHGMREVILGTVASDLTEHMDGTEDFVGRLDGLMRTQEGAIRVSAPAIRLTTLELIHQSQIPVSVLGWCHSCNVSNVSCLKCRACRKQVQTLQDLAFFSR